ncbi:MAG: hypothetical protein P1U56_11935 [Saprospiraceae bacterium]|nr:hypothetical protein [Saprospiraceae bacterium]
MNKVLLFFSVFVLSFGSMNGQNALSKKAKIDALNSVLHFVNESTHGMLIVHRMLENYNQDINKYADLESFKINYYTNKDLPKDIFEDPENWFYDSSPYEWYEIAVRKAQNQPYANSKQILAKMSKMKSILTQINQIRFDLDAKIIDKDLTDTAALYRVYDELQKGVDLYEDFFKIQTNLLKQVSETYKPLSPNAAEVRFPKLYKAMADVYLTTRDVLLAIRKKDDENISKLISRQEIAINAFNSIELNSFGSTLLTSRKVQRIKNNIEDQGGLSLASAKKFFGTAHVPKEYKQYGKFYYYYNSEIINKFNRYGNGIVFELNNLIEYLDIPSLIFTELPHYYKFILPKKLITVDHIAATDNKILTLPSMLKDREIQMSTRTIKVDSVKFEVSLYDHMIEDGDVISLNFNGDWIVEQMPLLAKPKKLKLMLNTEGKNYFILHAENVGRRPPNTMAVDYYYRGRKKQIILKSDLNVSEMIEIEYIK